MSVDDVVERLVAEPTPFHALGEEPRVWNALPGTLRLLARHARAGAATLETGAGASTVVFAASGAHHTAISPDPREHDRIRDYCRKHAIADDRVRFVDGLSERVLSAMEAAGEDPSLDLAFIDGAHAFPYPVLDFHHVARRLRVGGLLVLDDVPIPSVGVVFRHLASDPAWRLVEIADARAAAFAKVSEPAPGDPWLEQAFNRGYPDLSFLPWRVRVVHRTRDAGRRAARAVRRAGGRS